MLFADKGPATPLSELEKENFLDQFMEHFLPLTEWGPLFIGMEQNFDSYDVAWWVRSQDAFTKHSDCEDCAPHVRNVRWLFFNAHSSVSRNVVFRRMLFTDSFSSALGIEHVTLDADTSEWRCSRNYESSVGRFQAGYTYCAIDSFTWIA